MTIGEWRQQLQQQSGRGGRVGRGKKTGKLELKFPSINQGDVKSIIVPKPLLEEQGEIVVALNATEAKIAHSTHKAATLRDLFRTLLHALMTAKTRVHEIELHLTILCPIPEQPSRDHQL